MLYYIHHKVWHVFLIRSMDFWIYLAWRTGDAWFQGWASHHPSPTGLPLRKCQIQPFVYPPKHTLGTVRCWSISITINTNNFGSNNNKIMIMVNIYGTICFIWNYMFSYNHPHKKPIIIVLICQMGNWGLQGLNKFPQVVNINYVVWKQ